MAANFEIAQKHVAKWEGGLSDDKFDRGGITKYGVSFEHLKDTAMTKKGALASIGIITPITKDTIKNLTYEQAQSIFKMDYWIPCQCENMPLAIAVCVYDCAVNSGCSRSIKIIQKAYNRLFQNTPIAVDGIIGPKTLSAASKLNSEDGIKAIVEERKKFYKAIVDNRPNQRCFLKGWYNRVNDLEKYASSLL